MNWEGFFPRFWEESAFQKLVKFGGRKTNYFRSVVFPTPKPPTFPCTTKGLAALWTLARGVVLVVEGVFPYVTGLDVRNGSGEHSVCGSRDWARCQVRLFQRTVRSLRDGA